jgi:hypothetical protein
VSLVRRLKQSLANVVLHLRFHVALDRGADRVGPTAWSNLSSNPRSARKFPCPSTSAAKEASAATRCKWTVGGVFRLEETGQFQVVKTAPSAPREVTLLK